MATDSKGIVSEFLEKYKSLELILRVTFGSDMTVLKYEDTLDSESGDKLRICRVVRNFLQHTPKGAGFIQPSQAMLQFLEKEILRVTAQGEKAKDLAFKAPVIKVDMTLRDAARVFVKVQGKYDWLPVVDAKGIVLGVLTESRLMKAVSIAVDIHSVTVGDLVRKAELAKSLAGVPVVSATDNLESYVKLQQAVIVVRNGKYSGVIQW